MARLLKGKSHGKLGLHRLHGKNLYTKGGKQYKRTRKGFAEIRHRQKPGYDPLAPLTGKGLNKEVDAAAHLKYDPQGRQLGQEYRVSQAQTGRTNDYFNAYQATLAQAQARTQAAYQGAQQGVYNQANQAAGQDEQQRQAMNAQAQQAAAVRGTSASVQPEAQRAAQATRALSSSFGGMIGSQGAAATNMAGQQRIAGAQAKVGALQDEEKRRRQIAQTARDLAGEAGQYKVQYRGDLRDKERTYALNQQAFGLDVAKARSEDQDRRRRAANTRRGQNLIAMDKDRRFRLDKKKYGSTVAKDKYQRRHGLGPYKPASKGGRGGSSGGSGRGSAKYQKDYNKAYSLVRTAAGRGGNIGSHKWRVQTLDYLVGTKGLDRAAASRAIHTYARRHRRTGRVHRSPNARGGGGDSVRPT